MSIARHALQIPLMEKNKGYEKWEGPVQPPRSRGIGEVEGAPASYASKIAQHVQLISPSLRRGMMVVDTLAFVHQISWIVG